MQTSARFWGIVVMSCILLIGGVMMYIPSDTFAVVDQLKQFIVSTTQSKPTKSPCISTHTAPPPLGCVEKTFLDSNDCPKIMLECTSICGDGRINQPSEICDDGNTDNNDSCTNECTSVACGDGRVQVGEECDTAMLGDQCGGENLICNDCRCISGPYCGDGEINTPDEQCDDANNTTNDSCSQSCKRCPELFLPDAPPGCVYTTSFDEYICPIATLTCQQDLCKNGLQKSSYPDCSCDEGFYLAISKESCVVDPVSGLSRCGTRASCLQDENFLIVQKASEQEKSFGSAPLQEKEKTPTFKTQAYIQAETPQEIINAMQKEMWIILDKKLPSVIERDKLKRLKENFLEKASQDPRLQQEIIDMFAPLL